MKIFISWSGERSRTIAEALGQWLGDVLQSVDPWVSVNDLEKGARWNSEISTQLQQANFGLICLTPEAQESPWLLFEAGALSKMENSRVWTYLYDLDSEAVVSPLRQFQHTYATGEDTRKLLKTINVHLGEKKLDEQRLTRLFDKHWPDLKQVLRSTPSLPAIKTPQAPPNSLIPELFEYVRAQSEQLQKLSGATDEILELVSKKSEKRVNRPVIARPPKIEALILSDKPIDEEFDRILKGFGIAEMNFVTWVSDEQSDQVQTMVDFGVVPMAMAGHMLDKVRKLPGVRAVKLL